MSMEHKAYTFGWNRFEVELLPLLERALVAEDVSILREFIISNRTEVKEWMRNQSQATRACKL